MKHGNLKQELFGSCFIINKNNKKKEVKTMKKTTEQFGINYDFNRLLKLVKRKQFSSIVSDAFIDFHCSNDIENQMVYIYWNRFHNQFHLKKIDRNYLSNSDCLFNNYISYFTILIIDKNLYKEEFFNSIPKTKNKKLMEEFKEKISKVLVNKIIERFTDAQKNKLESIETGDWDWIIDEFNNGIFYPIDFLPEKEQFELFWSKTDLFNYSSYTKIIDELAVNETPYSLENLVLNDDFRLKNDFRFFRNYLINRALEELENFDIDYFYRSKLVDFIINEGTDEDNQKVKELISNPCSDAIANTKAYLSKLEKKLFNNSSEPLTFPSFSIPSTVDDELRRKTKYEIYQIIKKWVESNKDRAACYFEFTISENLNNVLSYINSKNLTITSSYSHSQFLSDNITFYGTKSIVYSPIYGKLNFSFADDKNFNKGEEIIKNNNIKTSKAVQDFISILLQSQFVNFSEEEKDHLRFVLSMDTID